jgi:DNA (cytosine-5)-methyltransferase 1
MTARWSVVDLFSGAGGASAGFAAHEDFAVIAAADAQIGKPSSKPGTLGCNETYAANIGIEPQNINLAAIDGATLKTELRLDRDVDVLVACPPCTGFSRTNANNHITDDPRNSLVARVADFATVLKPSVIVMENARELLMGRFSHHYQALRERLEVDLGYRVSASTHMLNHFGLPQVRERALIIATRHSSVASLESMWSGWKVDEKATHVRRAIWDLPAIRAGEPNELDPMHVSPAFSTDLSRQRIQAIPHDGGSWRSLVESTSHYQLATPGMLRLAARNKFGSFPDVYGRMYWDRPAPTIKRECGHVGNGRYSHPEQDRLISVREAALLQGFPSTYTFHGNLSNQYRHIGDAVPPLISYQLAAACAWALTGQKPELDEAMMPCVTLSTNDLQRST